jgi:nucleoside-triphosphatase THEP1
MNERVFYILTGAIQTGKTTALARWSKDRSDVFGILTPVIGGRRFFIDAHSRNQFEMEANESEYTFISIGRFKFSNKAFEKATQIISDSIGKGWLVIDEIGPLELNKQGFYGVTKKALENHSSQLLLVVREELVEKVRGLFDLKQCNVISVEDLERL